jgi:hypothetical protein
MANLSIDPSYLRYLIVKVRAFMGKEATDIPDDGSNPTDDPLPPALQDQEGDLSREEVMDAIRGLELRQQAELADFVVAVCPTFLLQQEARSSFRAL